VSDGGVFTVSRRESAAFDIGNALVDRLVVLVASEAMNVPDASDDAASTDADATNSRREGLASLGMSQMSVM
jgi:hypothetical protein